MGETHNYAVQLSSDNLVAIFIATVIPIVGAALLVWGRLGILTSEFRNHERHGDKKMDSIASSFRELNEELANLREEDQNLWKAHSEQRGRVDALNNLAGIIAEGLSKRP